MLKCLIAFFFPPYYCMEHLLLCVTIIPRRRQVRSEGICGKHISQDQDGISYIAVFLSMAHIFGEE
jgi:hypothetical protein